MSTNAQFIILIILKVNQLVSYMSIASYKFQEIKDEKWGIYFQNRLLATVSSYEACKSIEQYLNRNLSDIDTLKAAIAYKKAIDRSLIIG